MGQLNRWHQHEASPDNKSKYKVCEALTYKTAPGHYNDFLMSEDQMNQKLRIPGQKVNTARRMFRKLSRSRSRMSHAHIDVI